MDPVTRLYRDYRQTAPLNGLLNLWGFVDEAVFLCKSGAVGIALSVRGVDVEGLDADARAQVVHRFEAALRHLDESFRVYQYLRRTPHPDVPRPHAAHPVADAAFARRASFLTGRGAELFESEIVFVLISEGWQPRRSWTRRLRRLLTSPPGATLSSADTETFVEAGLARAVRHLRGKVDGFVLQLADTLAPRVMPKAETFKVLRRLLNYTPAKADAVTLAHDAHLDFFVADTTVECYRDHLRLDDQHVKVLTLKAPPAQTFAHLLADLHTLPTATIVCLEWQRVPHAAMRRELQKRRRHFFSARTSLVNYLHPDTRPEEMLIDDSATATVRELGTAVTALEVEGAFFGQVSLTVVVYDRDPQRLAQSVAACLKAFGTHDASVFEESYNLLNAWLAIVPGHSAYNLRRLPLLHHHYADLSLLFARHAGEPSSTHLAGAALATLETTHASLYHWVLHVRDIGHLLGLGGTGAGKSFLLNFLILMAQQYGPVTVIFDLGGSYRRLTQALDGRYLSLGLGEGTCTINPFALPPTPEHLHFLGAFVKVLIQTGGQYQTTHVDDREIEDAVAAIYSVDADQRRLFTLANLLPRPLAQHLRRWVQGGQYGVLFDNVQDTLTLAEFQCLDFAGMASYPLTLEPLLFYVLHRMSAVVQDPARAGQFKLFVLDEAWRFVRDDTIRAYLTEALKTWRKHNAAVFLATQSSVDFVHAALLRTVIESCPTKVFLSTPGFDAKVYGELFGLNDTELDLLAGLLPRRQFLLKRPDVTRVLNLTVDAETAALCTNPATANVLDPTTRGSAAPTTVSPPE